MKYGRERIHDAVVSDAISPLLLERRASSRSDERTGGRGGGGQAACPDAGPGPNLRRLDELPCHWPGNLVQETGARVHTGDPLDHLASAANRHARAGAGESDDRLSALAAKPESPALLVESSEAVAGAGAVAYSPSFSTSATLDRAHCSSSHLPIRAPAEGGFAADRYRPSRGDDTRLTAARGPRAEFLAARDGDDRRGAALAESARTAPRRVTQTPMHGPTRFAAAGRQFRPVADGWFW